jgi:AmpD protein
LRITDGWLDGVRRLPSPNCDARPDPRDISLIVIHNISLPPRVFGGPWIDAFFSNRLDPGGHPFFGSISDLRVSAHLLIRRDGTIHQYVPLERRAWHAGPSAFAGREACNDFSVGIELEGADDIPYTDCQYDRLAAVTRVLRAEYPRISVDRITGHEQIAPGRKTDPGPAFDWQRLREAVSSTSRVG